MDPFLIHGQGLVLDGHPARPGQARVAARAKLAADGVDDWDADQATEHARVARAWWGGDTVGFVNAGHPGALPVTVVHLPTGLTGAPPVRAREVPDVAPQRTGKATP